MEQRQINVFGYVQGVGYRFNAQKQAEQLGLTGWIKNEPDQTVTIVVQGKKEKIKEFFDWCKKGPSKSQVNKIKIKDEPIEKIFNNFFIK